MFKATACMALAVGFAAAYAQTDTTPNMGFYGGPISHDGVYVSDQDIMANPPTIAQVPVDYNIEIQDVRAQAFWLRPADRDHLTQMFWDNPANVNHILRESLYSARMQAACVRHDMVASDVQALVALEQSPSTGQQTASINSNTGENSDLVADSNLSDVSNRPLRMVLSNPRNANINYPRALHILMQGRSTTERAILADWWMNDASERDKDVLVRMLKNDAGTLKVPIYPSTLAPTPGM